MTNKEDVSSGVGYLSVPYGQTVHGEEEIAAVVEVLRTSTMMGKNVQAFQELIANLFSKRHGIMVNSGSSANHLAIEILKLEPGSEVITPAVTFSTTVAPIVKNSLIPSFVDVADSSFNIDVNKIEEMITPKTKLIMVPNLFGNMSDWDVIQSIAEKHSLKIIEDSCDTLGATLRGRKTGERSHISTTSFYGNHVINCAGNGGMLCVNDEALARQALLLRSWGRSSSLFVESEKIENRFKDVELDGIPYDRKFIFEEIGYNLEPSEMGAAFGLVQLSRLEANIQLREKYVASHISFFKPYENWFILPQQMPDSRTGWMNFPLTIRDSAPFDRKTLQIYFEQHGVMTRPMFTGNIMRQPGFKNIESRAPAEGCPVADSITRGGILIGCHHGLTDEKVAHIYNVFESFSKRYS